jgi:2-polyprenyl-6-methoxyphenol hydroxylase-like FAD-dependent oxidoreductase
MTLKIAICGGGIGGLTTALCIDRLCGERVELDVYEQASEYKVLEVVNRANIVGNRRRYEYGPERAECP